MKIGFSLVVLLVAIGHYYHGELFSQLFITLLFIAAAPWLIPFFAREFKVRNAELFGAKIEFLEQEVAQESMRLDRLFLLSMGDNTLRHLEKLGPQAPYGEFELRSSFLRELAYLECLGYIAYKPPLKGLDDLMQFKGGADLSEHIALTDRGKEFLALRSTLGRMRH